MEEQKLPELLTLKEACQILHVHANTLRNWEKSGKLQAVRIGSRRDRRFTKQSLFELFQNETQTLAA